MFYLSARSSPFVVLATAFEHVVSTHLFATLTRAQRGWLDSNQRPPRLAITKCSPTELQPHAGLSQLSQQRGLRLCLSLQAVKPNPAFGVSYIVSDQRPLSSHLRGWL